MAGCRLVAAAVLLACLAAVDGSPPLRRRNVVVMPRDARPGFEVWQFPAGHSYQLLDTGFSQYFAMLPDGLLMTTGDLKPLLGRTVVLIVVEDGIVNKTLILSVLDRQDMLSFNDGLKPATVMENAPAGTYVAKLQPSGGGASGQRVRYRLIGGDPSGAFRLDSDNGTTAALVTARPLDREQQAAYDLTFEAEDANGLERAVTSMRVHVIDENDNSPVFTKKEYAFTVDLGWKPPPGRFRTVGMVSATDADGDRVAYSLAAPSRVLVIVPQTGELLLAPDQPQEDVEYELLVDAHDLRSPSRSSFEPARIFLQFKVPPPDEQVRTWLDNEDVDDSANEVGLGPHEKKAATEAAPSVHRIAKRRVTRAVRPTKRIEFTEADGETEGRVVFQLEKETERETFKIRDENSWVTVEPNGAVRVKKKWDYEELGPEKTIDFWVTITNAAAAPGLRYTDNQRVIIHVKDVNDEPPYFINRPLPMQAVVQLNAPPNTPVFTLQARDPDTDHNIHYFIVRDRTGGRFEVDERSGVVRTRGTDPFQLDMEYVLYVKAEDQNGRVDERHFQSTPEERLSIVGGKRAPQFYMPSYEAEIPENQKKDSEFVYGIHAQLE